MFTKAIFAGLIVVLLTQMSEANNDISTTKKSTEIIAQQCYSEKWSKQALIELAKQNLDIEKESERNELALQLINCLAVPESEIRDGIAFTGLSKWLRANKLSSKIIRSLFAQLIENFGNEIQDENGVYQPFVALVLSELARVDRKSPYLSDSQRELLVTKSTNYMAGITDYRGFDDVVGWRHNVAHTADIFLQLALNPAIDKAQLSRLLDAIGQQVIPQQPHFYIYGESERLAMPLLYIFMQKQHTEEDWQNWLQRYISPAPLKNWNQAYASQQGLSKLHNAKAFLGAILVLIIDSENAQLLMLKPGLINALESFP